MLVSVALPLPLFQELAYAVPEALIPRATVGSRVVVPVRGRRVVGLVVGKGEVRAGLVAREILDAPDAGPVLDAPGLALARWISAYYAAPLGVVVRAMLPAALSGVRAS